MNSLKHVIFKGILFVIILGTLWHFVYEWTGKNLIAGLFFPVNESTWEHMKLLFFPMSIYSLFADKKLKAQYSGITSALLSGILAGTFSIPVIFYTYSGILGFHTPFLDIATFLGSVFLAFGVVYRFTLSEKAIPFRSFLSGLLLLLFFCFLVFSYFPPAIGIFSNP